MGTGEETSVFTHFQNKIQCLELLSAVFYVTNEGSETSIFKAVDIILSDSK